MCPGWNCDSPQAVTQLSVPDQGASHAAGAATGGSTPHVPFLPTAAAPTPGRQLASRFCSLPGSLPHPLQVS